VRWDGATCLTRNLTGALAARALPASWFPRQAGQDAVLIPGTAHVLPAGGCLRITGDAADQHAAVLQYTGCAGAPYGSRGGGPLSAPRATLPPGCRQQATPADLPERAVVPPLSGLTLRASQARLQKRNHNSFGKSIKRSVGGVGLAVRIRTQERQLTQALGEEYERFAPSRKRLLP
jgi:hypothetical protein